MREREREYSVPSDTYSSYDSYDSFYSLYSGSRPTQKADIDVKFQDQNGVVQAIKLCEFFIKQPRDRSQLKQ